MSMIIKPEPDVPDVLTPATRRRYGAAYMLKILAEYES